MVMFKVKLKGCSLYKSARETQLADVNIINILDVLYINPQGKHNLDIAKGKLYGDVLYINPQGKHNNRKNSGKKVEDVLYINPQGKHNSADQNTERQQDVLYINPQGKHNAEPYYRSYNVMFFI